MTAQVQDRRGVLFVAANTSIDRLVEVDRLVVGAINRPDRVVVVPGGKGLNAARAADALGGLVSIAAIVGGVAGGWIEAELASLDVATSLIRVGADTRTCLSVLDRSTGLLTEVYEPGGSIDDGDWGRLEALVDSLVEPAVVGAVAVTGSVPVGCPDDGYGRLVHLARARGMPVLVDAHGHQLAGALAERPDVVKLNAGEAGDATGMSIDDALDAAWAAASLRDRGAAAAVVTLGRLGAVVSDADETWWLTPPAEQGPYVVGAGDAFLGGLAVALVDGLPLLEACLRGMAAAVANTLTAGAGVLDPATARRLVAAIGRRPLT